MKYVLSFILFIWFSNSYSQLNQKVELKNRGFPEYRKLIKKEPSFPVFSNQNILEFSIPASVIYNFRGFKDTLSFRLFVDNEMKIQSIESVKLIDKFEVIAKENQLFLKDSIYEIMFSVSFQEADTITVDKMIGNVHFMNHFVRYEKFEFNDQIFNIAIIDKDLNGIIDQNDLIATSYDEYFLTATSSRSCFLKDTVVIKFEDESFHLIWEGGYNVRLVKINKHNQLDFDLTLDTKIYNLHLDKETNLTLSDLLNKRKYTIISVWSEFCPPCIASIPLLNQYSEAVIGIEQKTKGDGSRNEIEFKNYRVGKDEISKTNVNGYPNYFIIDDERNILIHSRRIEEILSFFEKINN